MRYEIREIEQGPEVYRQGLRWVVWDTLEDRNVINGWFRNRDEAERVALKFEKED